jgi:hypothetical protein
MLRSKEPLQNPIICQVERLNERHWVEDWSPDGRFLLTRDTKTFSIIPVGADSKPKALYSSSFIKDEFHLSPDMQLIAYGENRTGTWGVFLASFPSFQDINSYRWQAARSRFGAETAENFFSLDPQGKMMSATVERGSPSTSAFQESYSTLDLRRSLTSISMW